MARGEPVFEGDGWPRPAAPALNQSLPEGRSQAANPRAQAAARPAAAAQAAAHDAVKGDDDDLTERAIRGAPPWLISTAFHMAMLIVLGLYWVVVQSPSATIEFVQTADPLEEQLVYAEQLGRQLEIDSPLAKDDTDNVEDPVLTPSNLPEVENPFATPALTDMQPSGATAMSDLAAPQIGLALMGREEGSKRALLGKYGGNATTESAVQLGLQWLARNQQKSDSWSLAGPFTGGVPKELDNEVAATAMALLAFQGAGNTHQSGKFSKHVSTGWKWLLKQQQADGSFFQEGPHNHRFYTQGQCTIALCELLGMTKDSKYREPAERAVKYCLDSQSSEGGWRYTPRGDSDVSVTGWIVMALQSARMAGLKVPKENLERVERFLDKIALEEGSRYPYVIGQGPTVAMTAEALLCRQYLGWSRKDPRLVKGAEWITSPENLLSYDRARDVYYWYYATQMAHHMEGDYWKRWNTVMRQSLPDHQTKRGREAGSWDPERPTADQWAPYGGRLYVTCLSIYMLEVYYRHMPLYNKIYTNLLKSGRTDTPPKPTAEPKAGS